MSLAPIGARLFLYPQTPTHYIYYARAHNIYYMCRQEAQKKNQQLQKSASEKLFPIILIDFFSQTYQL
jgi:hypothetical protein